MNRVTLRPLPIEAEWRPLQEEFVPTLEDLELGFEVDVEPQGLIAGLGDRAYDLLVSVPWRELPAHFATLLNALIAWRQAHVRKEDAGQQREPYRVQVLYAPDGSVLKEIEIEPTKP